MEGKLTNCCTDFLKSSMSVYWAGCCICLSLNLQYSPKNISNYGQKQHSIISCSWDLQFSFSVSEPYLQKCSGCLSLMVFIIFIQTSWVLFLEIKNKLNPGTCQMNSLVWSQLTIFQLSHCLLLHEGIARGRKGSLQEISQGQTDHIHQRQRLSETWQEGQHWGTYCCKQTCEINI